MSLTLDHEGYFRATPYSWELRESTTSASVGVRLYYTVEAELIDGEWQEVSGVQPVTEGTVWIQTRDGAVNERGVRDLYYVLKWNGDPAAFADMKHWRPPSCEITVKGEEYKEKIQYRVQWIHTLGSKGQGRAIADTLSKHHGANYRRIIAQAAAEHGEALPAAPPLPPAVSEEELPF